MHTNKPIAQIADELHFPNPSFFSKYFKRIMDVPPGEYRVE
jgi:AraC-like DNA-binding protein